MTKNHTTALSALALFFTSTVALADGAWVIGQSAPLTGSNAAFGVAIRDGAMAYFKSVNARGGVAGKNIELVTMDDANDRKTAGVNTQKLLNDKNVIALFGYASATLSLDALPQAEKAEVLFFAPFSGAAPVRKASPVLFTLRASYAEELEKMLTFWQNAGVSNSVVVVHYEDDVGKQNLAVVTEFLKKHGKVPTPFALQRNANVDAAKIGQLKALRPDLIINTVLSGHAAAISKGLMGHGAFVPTSSLSFVGAQQYMDAAGLAGAGVSIAQVVPNASSRAVPIVTECAKAMVDAGMTQPMNSTHLEACIAAKVLTEAMRRAKKPDATTLLASMQNLGRYDTGGFSVHYASGKNHGSSFVELAMVTREGKLKN